MRNRILISKSHHINNYFSLNAEPKQKREKKKFKKTTLLTTLKNQVSGGGGRKLGDIGYIVLELKGSRKIPRSLQCPVKISLWVLHKSCPYGLKFTVRLFILDQNSCFLHCGKAFPNTIFLSLYIFQPIVFFTPPSLFTKVKKKKKIN